MGAVHVGEDPRLPSALLEEECVYNPSQMESQVAKPFPMLAYLTVSQGVFFVFVFV